MGRYFQVENVSVSTGRRIILHPDSRAYLEKEKKRK
jgi:hypothetical protein